MKKLIRTLYKNMIFGLMSVTDVFSRLDANLPGKWCYISKNLAAFNSILYCRLLDIDEELSEEYIFREELIEKKMGMKKFYSDDEVEKLKQRRDSIEI